MAQSRSECEQARRSLPIPGEQGLILNAVFDALYKSAVTRKEEPIDVSF